MGIRCGFGFFCRVRRLLAGAALFFKGAHSTVAFMDCLRLLVPGVGGGYGCCVRNSFLSDELDGGRRAISFSPFEVAPRKVFEIMRTTISTIIMIIISMIMEQQQQQHGW